MEKFSFPIGSHPVRVRGLKQITKEMVESLQLSHPVRVRGLKQRSFVYTAKDQKVAPRAGAWIETL